MIVIWSPERLATPSGAAAVLDRCGLAPRKGLGQSFWSTATCCGRSSWPAAQPAPGRHAVIEIGPGLAFYVGSGRRVRTVIAVEVDAGLVRWLDRLLRAGQRAPRPRRRLASGFHALRRTHPPGPAGVYKVIANLPYYIYHAAAHAVSGGRSRRWTAWSSWCKRKSRSG